MVEDIHASKFQDARPSALLNATGTSNSHNVSMSSLHQGSFDAKKGSPASPAGTMRKMLDSMTETENLESEKSANDTERGDDDGVGGRKPSFALAAKTIRMGVRLSSIFKKDYSKDDSLPYFPSRTPSDQNSTNDLKLGALGSVHQAEWKDVLEIYEEKFGRTYYFRCADDDECKEWQKAIEEAMTDAQDAYQRSLNLGFWEKTKINAKTFYDSKPFQIGVCLILMANFGISIVQTEMGLSNRGDSDEALMADLDFVEMIFTFIYLAELLLNMYANWFFLFFSSWWCWFDLVIVILSVVDAAYVLSGGGGSGLAVLRLLRVFRIVRIFNKLEDMKRILSANVQAFGPVANAFLLFLVLVSIYAVIAVNIFDTGSRECDLDGGCFGSFSLSFYTLMGIATGESWTPYVHSMKNEDGHVDTAVACFFVSFTVLVGIVALNIIVAVLLENFVSSMNKHDALKRIDEEAREHHKCAGALDPLLATLANFTSPQHFKSQLDLLFCLWDVDDNGSIDFGEMKNGIQRLGYDPSIQMSSDDWENFCLHGLLLNEDDEIDHQSFEVAMRFQLADYSQRLLANKMSQFVRTENEFAPLVFAMKMAILEIMASATDRRQADLAREQEIRQLGESMGNKAQVGEDKAKLGDGGDPAWIIGLQELMAAVGQVSSRLENVAHTQEEMKAQMVQLSENSKSMHATATTPLVASSHGLSRELERGEGHSPHEPSLKANPTPQLSPSSLQLSTPATHGVTSDAGQQDGELEACSLGASQPLFGVDSVTKDPSPQIPPRHQPASRMSPDTKTLKCACRSGKLFLECHGKNLDKR